MKRRQGLIAVGATLAAALTVLAGCSGLRTVSSEVATFGDWPAGRAAGSYAFERLPSQQARAADSEALENSARSALAKAGFKPAASGQDPEFLVQLGARETGVRTQLWDEPLWWRGGFGLRRYGYWGGPRWGYGGGFGSIGYYAPIDRYDRQVALLIRDHASGKPLFEARASSEGSSQASSAVQGAMFEAALFDFPRLGINPRKVSVALTPQ